MPTVMPDPDSSIGAFDYDLPPGAIAQQPVEPRDAARLLVDAGPDAAPEHRHVVTSRTWSARATSSS